MASHIEFEQWVPFPLDLVFTFFSDPENLPKIMPTSSATRLVEVKRVPPSVAPAGLKNEKATGTGSILVTSFRVFPFLPFRQQWIARITEFEWNHHFADVQERGPFQSWHHRHEFTASSRNGMSGTTIRDVIDYEIGFGLLGRLVDAPLVRRQMDSTFRERQRKLPELLRK
jgi:ligand-binding SRPBCC domain-containing protein